MNTIKSLLIAGALSSSWSALADFPGNEIISRTRATIEISDVMERFECTYVTKGAFRDEGWTASLDLADHRKTGKYPALTLQDMGLKNHGKLGRRNQMRLWGFSSSWASEANCSNAKTILPTLAGEGGVLHLAGVREVRLEPTFSGWVLIEEVRFPIPGIFDAAGAKVQLTHSQFVSLAVLPKNGEQITVDEIIGVRVGSMRIYPTIQGTYGFECVLSDADENVASATLRIKPVQVGGVVGLNYMTRAETFDSIEACQVHARELAQKADALDPSDNGLVPEVTEKVVTIQSGSSFILVIDQSFKFLGETYVGRARIIL